MLDIWAAVGAGAQIADGGRHLDDGAHVPPRPRAVQLDLQPSRGRSPLPPFVNISQARTEEILDERIAAEPLDRRRAGATRSARLAQDDDGVTLDLRGRRAVRARAHVVACAGRARRAAARRWASASTGRAFDDRFLICDIRADLPGWETERRFYFDPAWNPGRQVLIHPCPDSTFRIDWQVPPDFDLAAEEASGGARPADPADRRRARRTSSSGVGVPVPVADRDRMRVGRVLLAGEL